jgi:hypothetical protein
MLGPAFVNTIPFHYLVTVGDETKLDYVFEGIIRNSKVDHFVPMMSPPTSENPRVQLQPGTTRSEYTKIYNEQLRNIIEGYNVYEGQEEPLDFEDKRPEKTRKPPKTKRNSTEFSLEPRLLKHVPGLFPKGSKRANFDNWVAAANIVKGGENYQHAHCDQGQYDEYSNLELFPFVALHAFGQESFKLWVLPQPDKRTYGFLHTFSPKNIVFMRGDFVHAGGVGTKPRGHMEFFPREEAGWNRTKSWWNFKSKGPIPTYLFQRPTFPFGFPSASPPDPITGDIYITYPPKLSQNLSVPLTEAQCLKEGLEYVPEPKENARKRKRACNEVQGQCW